VLHVTPEGDDRRIYERRVPRPLVLRVGDVEIGLRVTRPKVPDQRLPIFAYTLWTKRGGFEQRLGGAQRQQVREGPLVQRIEQGGNPIIEDRSASLDAPSPCFNQCSICRAFCCSWRA
jgi:hypothetical protein